MDLQDQYNATSDRADLSPLIRGRRRATDTTLQLEAFMVQALVPGSKQRRRQTGTTRRTGWSASAIFGLWGAGPDLAKPQCIQMPLLAGRRRCDPHDCQHSAIRRRTYAPIRTSRTTTNPAPWWPGQRAVPDHPTRIWISGRQRLIYLAKWWTGGPAEDGGRGSAHLRRRRDRAHQLGRAACLPGGSMGCPNCQIERCWTQHSQGFQSTATAGWLSYVGAWLPGNMPTTGRAAARNRKGPSPA